MKKKKVSNSKRIEQEEWYIEFLKKRLDSKNYKNDVSPGEYKKTQKNMKRQNCYLNF